MLFNMSKAKTIIGAGILGGIASATVTSAWSGGGGNWGSGIAGGMSLATGGFAAKGAYTAARSMHALGLEGSYKAGHLLAPALIGAGTGMIAGPTDSTSANAILGATGGIGGAGMARGFMGKSIYHRSTSLLFSKVNKNKAGKELMKTGGFRGFLGIKNGNMYGGIRTYGDVHKKHQFELGKRGVSRVGAGAGGLFAAAAAHGTIGSSRRSKAQNQLNR